MLHLFYYFRLLLLPLISFPSLSDRPANSFFFGYPIQYAVFYLPENFFRKFSFRNNAFLYHGTDTHFLDDNSHNIKY